MGEVSLNINGRQYDMECDDGQEERVYALGDYVDAKIAEIAAAGAAGNEEHLLVLASLMLTDEVFELRENINGNAGTNTNSDAIGNEEEIAKSIENLAGKIEKIAARIQKA